jgi:membrane protein implicated in regulation of membrane protease activity
MHDFNSLIGEIAFLEEPLYPGQCKQVRCQGTWYKAKCVPGIFLEAGEEAVVVALDRITLIVDRCHLQ